MTNIGEIMERPLRHRLPNRFVQVLRRTFDALPEQEAQVMRLRMSRTSSQTAEELGIGLEEVREIEDRACARLAALLELSR